MYDYGNARIAARRAHLLSHETLARLAHAESPDAMLVMLERLEDWAAILRELGPIVSPARPGIELAVERHRSTRLAALPCLFEGTGRALVEALVMPLDLERVLEVIRRRSRGEAPEAVAASASRGALLDDAGLGAIARAANPRHVIEILARFGLVPPGAGARATKRGDASLDSAEVEKVLCVAIDEARMNRARAAPDGSFVVAILENEREEAGVVLAELTTNGPEAAAEVERELRLARLDNLARRGRRDPLGIGAAAGYVAAIEAQAIRVRAALAGVAGGWSHERTGSWLATRAA